MNKHWTERMFVERPSLFRVALERVVGRADIDVDGLEKIFSEFGIPEDGLVLDLCCGIGRHSVVLAERGFKAIGVDLSAEFIARARELACERKVGENTEFRVGDMRQIARVLKDRRKKFDAVVSLVTSIGYYDEDTDLNVFTQLRDLTVSNGILVIDVTNRDWIIRHFQGKDITSVDDDLVKVEERNLNLENSRMETLWKYYERKERNLKFLDAFEVNHRIYSLHELKKLVEQSGWAYQTCYGSLDLDALTMDSNRLVLVAKNEVIG